MVRRAFRAGAIVPTSILLDTGQRSGASTAPAALGRLRATVAATAGVDEVSTATLSADGRVARLTIVYRDDPYRSRPGAHRSPAPHPCHARSKPPGLPARAF